MKIFYSLYMFQLIIFKSVQVDSIKHESADVTIPLGINLNVLCEDPNDGIVVGLEPVETFLANKNLPVWIVEEENPTELKLLTNVMEELGPFTAYRDLHSCSAALYFHNTKQFEGTLGHLYVMHKLQYNPVTEQIEITEDTLFESPIVKHGNRLVENRKPPVKTAGDIRTHWVKSQREYPDIVYIETLVVINYDIAEDVKSNYAAVVTYVLTLFNSVDMLYSKIKIPKIKINLAGIIIGNTPNSFPHLRECYEQLDDRPLELMAICFNQVIGNILLSYQLPFQSYDIAVFLTRLNLGYFLNTRDGQSKRFPPGNLKGIAFWEDNIGYKRSYMDLGVALVSDPTNLENFPTVAHEMAHLFGVPHDEGPLWKEDGTCDAHLMKKDVSLCKKCLPFGGRSPEHLKNFFGTRDACIFHNKPRSLEDPPGLRVFWKPRQQCKCYGYITNHKPRELFHIFTRASVDCHSYLKCVDEKGAIHDTNFYMDGTPCKKNRHGIRVCWNRKCVPIEEPTRNVCKKQTEI